MICIEKPQSSYSLSNFICITLGQHLHLEIERISHYAPVLRQLQQLSKRTYIFVSTGEDVPEDGI